MLPDSRACTKCGLDKPLSEFSKAPRGKYGRKASCKQCDAARHAEQHVPKPRRPRREPFDGTESKTCTRCDAAKPISEFSLSRKATETQNAVYRPWCKVCQAAAARQWFADNPDRAYANRRRHSLESLYGITVDEYDALLEVQGGVCAICRQPETKKRAGKLLRLTVDHCHKSGRVRGLLCNCCNRAIGFFKDDADLLKTAISYLERGEQYRE